MSVKAVSWAFQVKGLKPAQKLILLSFADFADDNGECYPAYGTIADKAECNKRTVMRAVTQFKKLGIISKVTQRRTRKGDSDTNVYTFDLSRTEFSEPEKTEKGSDNLSPRSDTAESPPVVTELSHHRSDRAVSPKPSLEPSIEPSLNNSCASSGDDASHIDDGPDWISSSGKPLTGKKLELFKKFWDAFGYRKGRARAITAWLKIVWSKSPEENQNQFEQIIRAATAEAEQRPALINNNRTPIYPEGWLSQRRWEDETPDLQTMNGGSAHASSTGVNHPERLSAADRINRSADEYEQRLRRESGSEAGAGDVVASYG